VAVRASRDDANVVEVIDGSNDTCSKNELLPRLADVDDVDACMGVRRMYIAPMGDVCSPSARLFQT
jgi:hypothetical protein